MGAEKLVHDWSIDDVGCWLDNIGLEKYKQCLCYEHLMDGNALMLLTEDDIRKSNIFALGDIKRLWTAISNLQISNDAHMLTTHKHLLNTKDFLLYTAFTRSRELFRSKSNNSSIVNNNNAIISQKRFLPSKKTTKLLASEEFRTFVSVLYWCVGFYVTAFVMTLTHDRHPDPTQYPPLPDLLFELIPMMTSAFHWAEICCMIMSALAILLLIFHKHRLIILRRAAVLSSSIFLFRCVTMYTTSLSVPDMSWSGHCTKKFETFENRIRAANKIFIGCGMVANEVHVCGDYFYSGHTASLTLMCLFIIEYTPRKWRHLHYFCWFMNFFTMFLILASHLHYTIDVVVSFFITIRMFYSYHTLASTIQVRDIDEKRRWRWFPMFSFFENGTPLVVPNEYELPITINRLQSCYDSLEMRLKLLIEIKKTR